MRGKICVIENVERGINFKVYVDKKKIGHLNNKNSFSFSLYKVEKQAIRLDTIV